MSKQKNVLFLVPYPLQQAPSQRFRVELFLPLLQQNGIEYRVEPFIDAATWKILYSNASGLHKGLGVLKGFLKRLLVVFFVVPKYTFVFIHREASPIGPPFFEWIISKVLRKKIIYDFDDAIWIPNTSAENKIVDWVKAFWKVKYICKWAYKVAGGNAYLCNYAGQYNSNVVFLPTCVDTEKQHNKLKNQYTPQVIIGWTGSHSTMKFFDDLLPVLDKAAANNGLEFVLISNKPPRVSLPRLQYIRWQEATEIDDLLTFNIGLMPLKPDAWCEGKCGFKLIQYLALGIPAIASPVGVNSDIIEQGSNGFLCSSEEEWADAITLLTNNADLRSAMGKAGREKIKAEYSVQANAGVFLSLFK